MACQVIKVSSHSSEEEETLAEEDQQPIPYESEDEGESDPMVSGVIQPFSIPVKIIVPKLGAQGEMEAS